MSPAAAQEGEASKARAEHRTRSSGVSQAETMSEAKLSKDELRHVAK
jgi:hypothetical protein